MTDLRFPIGQFNYPETANDEHFQGWVNELETFPKRLRDLTEKLNNQQLDTPYRPEGWSVRQVIHHLADSHTNAYLRVKLTLTEENPVIRPYDENSWALLADAKEGDIEMSLAIIEAIHRRMVSCLRNVSKNNIKRPYTHPDSGQHTLHYLVGLYNWHGNHHYAHILSTLK